MPAPERRRYAVPTCNPRLRRLEPATDTGRGILRACDLAALNYVGALATVTVFPDASGVLPRRRGGIRRPSPSRPCSSCSSPRRRRRPSASGPCSRPATGSPRTMRRTTPLPGRRSRSHLGYPEDAAAALKLPVATVAAICADLEAAGSIEAPPVH